MAKKKSTSRKPKAHHEKNAKAVLSILVLLLALAVLFIFIQYQNNILGNQPQLFMILVAGFFALLIGLLFLINKAHV